MQAQEYQAAKWSLALRMPDGTTDARIERAFNEGHFLRTHVLRPTWHFVAASDIHWMLELTAPRVHRSLAHAIRQAGLGKALCIRVTRIFERALGPGDFLTRAELGQQLARAGMPMKGLALALLTVYAELEGVICSGPQRGKQLTYALLATRAPRGRRLSRDEALAELAIRYFRSHGPATIRDFVWWSGLTTADARRGLEISRCRHKAVDGLTYWTHGRSRAGVRRRWAVHLLPTFDEYFVAYRDLRAVPRHGALRGVLQQTLVSGGQIAGTWKTIAAPDRLTVEVKTHKPLTDAERRALTQTKARYAHFLGRPFSVVMVSINA